MILGHQFYAKYYDIVSYKLRVKISKCKKNLNLYTLLLFQNNKSILFNSRKEYRYNIVYYLMLILFYIYTAY